ncbi:hypothetical protein DPMN_045790 [Dreissena polymorpha]|uniref:Uncharacterized protein n=1 Tax=Dreissena polymorpha TaxID=45954 RepID=A0A9D4D8F5_DREPO|nr:hypothetical protein DPMN_045790 [Dreissena polymorpha]
MIVDGLRLAIYQQSMPHRQHLTPRRYMRVFLDTALQTILSSRLLLTASGMEQRRYVQISTTASTGQSHVTSTPSAPTLTAASSVNARPDTETWMWSGENTVLVRTDPKVPYRD